MLDNRDLELQRLRAALAFTLAYHGHVGCAGCWEMRRIAREGDMRRDPLTGVVCTCDALKLHRPDCAVVIEYDRRGFRRELMPHAV